MLCETLKCKIKYYGRSNRINYRSLIGEFWGHLNRLTPERPISDMSAIGIKSYIIFKIFRFCSDNNFLNFIY